MHTQDSGSLGESDDDLIPYTLTTHTSPATVTVQLSGGNGHEIHSPARATLSHLHELHGAASERSCLHAEIDISALGLGYAAGDHVALFAELDPQTVEEVGHYLTHPLDAILSMAKPANNAMAATLPDPIPGPLPLRTALQLYADVYAHPSKPALRALA